MADLLSHVFLIAGIAVRELSNDETFNSARRLLGFSLIFMYLRCLKVFLVYKTMGPTLIMIKEMVWTFNAYITNLFDTLRFSISIV